MPYTTHNGITYWNLSTSPPARPAPMPASMAIGMAIVRMAMTPGPYSVKLMGGETIWTTKEPRR